MCPLILEQHQRRNEILLRFVVEHFHKPFTPAKNDPNSSLNLVYAPDAGFMPLGRVRFASLARLRGRERYVPCAPHVARWLSERRRKCAPKRKPPPRLKLQRAMALPVTFESSN